MPTRADVEALLHEFTQGDALRKHGRAVEDAMRAYACWFGVTFLIDALKPIAGEIGL